MAFFSARCNPDGKARWPGYMVSFHPVRYGAVEREVYNSQLLHLCIASPPAPGTGALLNPREEQEPLLAGAELGTFKLMLLHLLINAVPWQNSLFHVSVKRIFLFYSVKILHNFWLIFTET